MLGLQATTDNPRTNDSAATFRARPVGRPRRPRRGRRHPRHDRAGRSTASASATRASGSASTTACRRSSAPRPRSLMAAIAARTARIRIGSAGVMLPHYSALKVAEQFRVLDALAPGPHRPRRRPRAGRRHAHRARAEPECAARGRGLSRSRCATCRPGSRADARGPSRHHARIRCEAAHAPRALDPRQLGLRRAARRALRPAVCLRLFLHRRAGRRAGAASSIGSLYRPSERHPRAAGDAVRLGARRRQRRRGAAPRARPRALARRPRARRLRPAAGARRRSPRAASTPTRCRRIEPMRAQGLRRQRGATVGDAAARAGGAVRARRDRRQHLGPRPGRAAALLRAAGARVRLWRCMQALDLELRGEHITLDALLKATGLAPSGGGRRR